MRRTLATLSVLVLLSLFPAPSFAFQNEVDRIFYNDCGPNRVAVGEIFTDCRGNTTSWGVTSDFEERHTTTGCDGPTRTTYWECGVQVSSLDVCIC
jgi:hypothetical protein